MSNTIDDTIARLRTIKQDQTMLRRLAVRLAKALELYADHRANCPALDERPYGYLSGDDGCTCGLGPIRAAARKAGLLGKNADQ